MSPVHVARRQAAEHGSAAPRALEGGEFFAGCVAHELRTPLATQRALLELALANPNTDAADWREIGEDVLAACRQQEWLLGKAIRVFGHQRINRLQPAAIAAWRMTVPYGHRFEATQALRQVLARAVEWGMIDVNPAKKGVDNPQRRRTEKRPFESWAQVHALATAIGQRFGPVVLFAAATGLRPGEWMALEHRDIDLVGRTVSVERSWRNGRIKYPKTAMSYRSVPLQAVAMNALAQLPAGDGNDLVFPAPEGGYFDLHNFRNRYWKAAQTEADIRPVRRVYDLRHTFATFALRAGVPMLDVSSRTALNGIAWRGYRCAASVTGSRPRAVRRAR